MNSDQIAVYLSQILAKSRVNSIFVLARNELPSVNISRTPVAIVVNTDDRRSEGKHWCAFFVNSKRLGYFFDSYNNSFQHYGFEPPFQIIGTNSKVLQAPESDSCGSWCLLWLYYMSKSKSLKSFDSKYSTNLSKNDLNMLREFNQKFKSQIISYDTIDHCQTCCSRIKNKH